MNKYDWESVIERHLDGIASAEEIAALSEKLESDADTRLLYLRLAGIHATLATGELDEPASSEDEEDGLVEPNEGEPVNLLIAKQRNGPTGDVCMTFFKSYTRFENAARISSEDVPME